MSNTYVSYKNESLATKAGSFASNQVFSGTDMTAYITLPNEENFLLGNIAMISVSTHRDKFPVTSLGRVNVKGFTSGHRTIGGTIVCVGFDRNSWYKLVEASRQKNKEAQKDSEKSPSRIEEILPDQMPPFNVTIAMVNELGATAFSSLIGVTILDEGTNYSVENIGVMESYSFMAERYVPLQPYAEKVSRDMFEEDNFTGTRLDPKFADEIRKGWIGEPGEIHD